MLLPMLWDLCCGKTLMLCTYAVDIRKSLPNDSVTVIRPLHTRCLQSYNLTVLQSYCTRRLTSAKASR